MLMDDLIELEEFLKQRIVELSSDTMTSGYLLVDTSLPDTIQVQSCDDVTVMVENVTKVMQILTTKRMQHLLLILGSQRYIRGREEAWKSYTVNMSLH